MKNLLKDACSEIAFTFNVKIYKEIDGASIWFPLGLLLANIFMIDLENNIMQKLIDKKFTKFYTLYVDDNLL